MFRMFPRGGELTLSRIVMKNMGYFLSCCNFHGFLPMQKVLIQLVNQKKGGGGGGHYNFSQSVSFPQLTIQLF